MATIVSVIVIVYRAVALRRVLVDGAYRSRALWTAVGGSALMYYLVAQYVDSVYGQTPTTYTGIVVEGVIWGALFLSISGWIVSNANVAISADYFNRDALFWKKGGKFATPVVLIVAYILASLPSWWVPAALRSAASNDFILVLFVAVVVYPALVMGITYRRISDKRIKAYTLWVVFSILSLLLFFFLPFWLGIVAVLVWVFCMYRSVDSLAIRTHSLTFTS